MNWKKPLGFWAGSALMYAALMVMTVIIQFVLLHGLDWAVCRAFLAGSAGYWAIVLIVAIVPSRWW